VRECLAGHGASSSVSDEPRPLTPLACDRCGVYLHPTELRRESLDVFGQELFEVHEGGRVRYVCPRSAKSRAIGVMQASRHDP
jgi:hypothetical protein